MLEVGAALLHFDEDDGLPDVVGEGGAAAVLVGLADAEFGVAADIEEAGWPKAWKRRSRKIWAWPFSSPVMWAAAQATNSWRRDLRSVAME